ncbi:MAG: Crp/Fnr family transcriptional regulator [Acutalibacteraceae bacterium]
MNKYSVFCDMTEREISDTLLCLNSEEKKYKKGDIIMRFTSMSENVGIMYDGLAYLMSVNTDGEKSIIEYYEPQNLFGNRLSLDANENLYYIIAKKNCTVKFFRYDLVISQCKKNCQNHLKFINNIIYSTSAKSRLHINVLSQRKIRNKLLMYFEFLSQQSDSTTIRLPLPLSDLADYLAVDRSAMMRELKKMNDENIISSKGTKVTIMRNS